MAQQLAMNLDTPTRPTFAIYRAGGDLQQRIKAVITEYYQRCNAMPRGVTVHTSELDAARKAVLALGWRLEVRASGGCLVPEVWLTNADLARQKAAA